MKGSEGSLMCPFPPSIFRQAESPPQCRHQASWPLNLWGFSCLHRPIGVLGLQMCVIASGFT
ncbi:rCG57456 [Rattus norvegicus]|uniref:RCG57456 n=1 Tax=Rattus norvegicus TaxID=10116 RepID=A6JI24_RAT|nr:rCG57456 [Rattus norvegicus]